MRDGSNSVQVVIKRKYINSAEDGHHGGAWKVAYADFVTALMAFFLLMWLLSATTERQRKGLADYFNPTIAVAQLSGGGKDLFSGDSTTAENILSQNGLGATAENPVDADRAAGAQSRDDKSSQADEEARAELDKALLSRSGEALQLDRLRRHVITRVTDEGIVIELFDLPDTPLFEKDSTTPTFGLQQLVGTIAQVLRNSDKALAIAGHIRAYPLVRRENPVWSLSGERARAMQNLLIQSGLPDSRFARITGYADRQPVTGNPADTRNNRIELILLRPGYEQR